MLKHRHVAPLIHENMFFALFVDGEFAFSLDPETFADAGLHEEDEIEPSRLEELRRQSDTRKAVDRALDILALRDHAAGELYQKLCRHYPGPIAAEAVAKCKEYGLLDDAAYAKKLAEYYLNRKLFSFRRALMEMGKKGLDRQLAKESLKAVQADPVEQLEKIIQKRYAKKLGQGKEGRQKVFAALARLGFDYEDIKTALSEYNWEENEDE